MKDFKINSELPLVFSRLKWKKSNNKIQVSEYRLTKVFTKCSKTTRLMFTKPQEMLFISKDIAKELLKFQFKMPEPSI
jgi:hypothetical protein